MAKSKRVVEQLKMQQSVEVPWEVWRFLGRQNQRITLAGDHASLGEDYGTIEELRFVIEFYADQLGGKVTWE